MSRISRLLKPEHLTPDGFNELRDMWQEMVTTVNGLQGFNGDIQLHGHVNLNGNLVRNSGVATKDTDLLTTSSANPIYASSAQQQQLDALGKKILQNTRFLNDGTRQHVISTDLNRQGSVPPSNITGTLAYTTVAGSSITFTWTSVIVQLADLSYVGIKNGTLTATGLANVLYNFYPYYDTKLGILVFVADNINGQGAPPIAFLTGIAHVPENTAAAQQQTADGRISLTSGAAAITINGSAANVGLRTR